MTVAAGASVLADPGSELEGFIGRLEEELPPNLYGGVVHWLNEACPEVTAPLWNAVGRRCEHLGALGEQADGNETAEQGQARIQSYFETVNPGPIAAELQRAATLHNLPAQYHRSIGALVEDPVVGPVVRRYLVPDEVLRGLAAACVAPLQSCLGTLGGHANQMKAHADLLRSLQESKGLKTGVGVAATIAGGLLLGPIGAVAARALTGAAMDPSARINESAERVGGTFEQFRASFVSAMEQVDTNVLSVYASLYGGLLLRVQEDLAVLGRSLTWVDFTSATAGVGLSDAESQGFLDWALSSLSGMDALAGQGNWQTLGDVADKALRLTLADPLQVSVADEQGVAFVVHFAPYRATALNAVADAAWEAGNQADACQLYRHLLEQTNVAWEREFDDGDYSPSWSAARAGWRLALAATSDNPPPESDGDVLVLPEYAVQTLFRFASERPHDAAPGEMVTGFTFMVAGALARFAGQMLGAPISVARVPPHLRASPPEGFAQLVEGTVDFGSLGALIPEEWSAGGEGRLLDWYRAGVEAADRTATWLGCAVLGGGLLLLVAAIWLIVKWVT